MRRHSWFFALVAVLALSACSGGPRGVAAERDNPLIAASYDAVDRLLATQSRAALVGPGTKVLVATVADLNFLDRPAPFGRLMAEQLASRLAQLGMQVTELKLRGTLYVAEGRGELMLSRELKEIVASQNAAAVLVGTYVDGDSKVYVTLKLVRASDAGVISAYNFAIDKVGSIGALMRRETP